MSGADLLDQLVGVGEAVWRASWQASVLAALVLAVQLIVGKRLPARWRHAMWVLVLVRLALPVVPSSPLSVFNLAPKGSVESQRVEFADVDQATIAWNTSATIDVALKGAANSTIDDVLSAKPQATFSVSPRSALGLWAGWPQVLATLWVVGVLLLALRVAWATWRVSRTMRRLAPVDDAAVHDVLRATGAELGVRRLPLLLAGEGFFSPALVGCLRPKLLVPRDLLEQFAPDELRLIFLHELAHLKRRDVAINWLATLLTVLHWPNPVAWLVAWRLRLERELACDELVMSATSDTDRRAYGHTIVKLLETFSRGPAARESRQPLVGGVGILEGKAQMKRRIIMIAQFARSSRAWTVAAAAIVIALALVALTDAVQAEAPATPARPSGQKTIKMADGTVVPHDGTVDLVQRSITVNGEVIATNDYDRLAGPVPGGDATSRPTSEEIAERDPAMRLLLQQLQSAEKQREDFLATVGPQHVHVMHADAQIKAIKDQIAARAEQYLARMSRPTKLKTGDLVTVSIMDLVGQGVETVKTARIDGDGTINLPYVGAVKAAGLSPRELEKAVAKAYLDQSVIQNAVVAVSMPERGESHQIAKLRDAAPAAAPMLPGGFAPGPLDPAMADPAMLGIAPAAAAPVPEDPAAKAILGRKLPEMKLDNIPFTDVIDFLRDTTETNIFVNWKALEGDGIDRAAPVSLRLKDVAFKDALALIIRDVGGGEAKSGLRYKVENGVVVIDVAQPVAKPAKMTTKAYDVDRLLVGRTADERRQTVDQLLQIVMTNVKPHLRSDGQFVINRFDERLIVTTSDDAHRDVEQILKLLERNGGAKRLAPESSTTRPAAGALPGAAPPASF